MYRFSALTLIAALSATAGSASAATITLSQLDLNGAFSSSDGTTVGRAAGSTDAWSGKPI